MKDVIIALIIGLVLLSAGIVILLSGVGMEHFEWYNADGKILLTHDEYEQFKQDLAKQDNASIKSIDIINSGEHYLIQLNHISVTSDFKYGEITTTTFDSKSANWIILEVMLLVTGSAIIIVMIGILVREKEGY
jgi:hypothetical protein